MTSNLMRTDKVNHFICFTAWPVGTCAQPLALGVPSAGLTLCSQDWPLFKPSYADAHHNMRRRRPSFPSGPFLRDRCIRLQMRAPENGRITMRFGSILRRRPPSKVSQQDVLWPTGCADSNKGKHQVHVSISWLRYVDASGRPGLPKQRPVNPAGACAKAL